MYGNICAGLEIECIYKWKFKILENKFGIYIGFDSSNKKFIDGDYSDAFNQYKYYAYGDGEIYKRGSMGNVWPRGIQRFGVGSIMNDQIIQIELNTRDKTIRYIVDDKDYGIAFKNVDITSKYHLGITVYNENTSIQILSFEKNLSFFN